MNVEEMTTTTIRMTKEVHRDMMKWIAEYNFNIKWDERKMTIGLLTAKAIQEYIERHKNL